MNKQVLFLFFIFILVYIYLKKTKKFSGGFNILNNIDKIYLSVLCFNKDIKCNIFIDIEKIYKNFLLIKDEKYNSSEYKSYICYLKSNIKL